VYQARVVGAHQAPSGKAILGDRQTVTHRRAFEPSRPESPTRSRRCAPGRRVDGARCLRGRRVTGRCHSAMVPEHRRWKKKVEPLVSQRPDFSGGGEGWPGGAIQLAYSIVRCEGSHSEGQDVVVLTPGRRLADGRAIALAAAQNVPWMSARTWACSLLTIFPAISCVE
jgi:hypothetical protein